MQLLGCLYRCRQLVFIFAALVFSTSVQAGSLKIEFPSHHIAYHHTGNSVTVQSALEGYNYYDWYEIEYFDIHINGTTYAASLTETDWDIKGQYTLSLTGAPNPKQYDCYATVGITWSYYGYVFYDELDSRNNSGHSFPGNGHVVSFILPNIKLKGLSWGNRPCDVYDHVKNRNYPNSLNPYHWRQTQTALGTVTLGPYPAVYVKNTQPTLITEVENLTGSVPVRVRLNLEMSSSTPGYPFEHTTILSGNTSTTLCPALKNEVNIVWSNVTENFECQFADGYWSGIYGRQADTVGCLPLYVVFAQPVNPQSTPYIAVLNYTCQWASGKNTAADVAKHLTTGLFFAGLFQYDTNTSSQSPTGGPPGDGEETPVYWSMEEYFEGTGVTTFNLGGFLDASKPTPGICVDVSDFLCICVNAQGLGFQVGSYNNNPEYAVVTNNICAIGSDPTVTGNYLPYPIWFHQIALSSTDTVYDSCYAQSVDLSGTVFNNPPFNWPLGDYWQTVATPNRGLVNYPYNNNPLIPLNVTVEPQIYSWNDNLPNEIYVPAVVDPGS